MKLIWTAAAGPTADWVESHPVNEGRFNTAQKVDVEKLCPFQFILIQPER